MPVSDAITCHDLSSLAIAISDIVVLLDQFERVCVVSNSFL